MDITTLTLSKDDIKELRKVQIRLLNELNTVCEKHGLIYWIDFGTLLGAVRSKDFIPWDDDIDISMPMEDYKKFIKIAATELPRDIFVQTIETDPGYKQAMTKLRDCYSTYIEHYESEETLYHKGIFLDIFPAYNYPNLPKIIRKIMLRVTLRTRYDAYVREKNVWINYPIYLLCKFAWWLLLPFKSDRFGQIPEDNGYNYAVPGKFIFPLQKIKFAGGFYPAPCDTDEYLTQMYGPKYITPPPNRDRAPHAKLILPHTPCKHSRAIN